MLLKIILPIMKQTILFLFILLLLPCTYIFSQSDFVSIKNRDFVLPNGEVLYLKGINLGNWLVPEGYMFKFKNASSPRLINEVINELLGPQEAIIFWKKFRENYITKEDIIFIKKCGLNSVRVPFNFRLFVNEDNPYQRNDTGFEMLSKVVQWCSEENLYVILDMHCAPGGQTGDNIDDSYGYPFLFESKDSRKLTIDLWREIADKFKNNKYVIGYDLLNEPIAHYFDTTKLNPLLEPFYKELTAEIRKVDKNHILFLGGAQWDSNFKIFGPPFDNKTAYTFHKYWTDTTISVIQDYIDYGKKYNVPIWMGESGENTMQWITSFRTLLDNNKIGWCFWPYKKMDSDRCMLSVNIPAMYDSILAYANEPRSSYAEIRKISPSKDIIKTSLNSLLEEIKFQNCKINMPYLKALNLKNIQAEKK